MVEDNKKDFLKTLDDILKEQWDAVREEFFYPPLSSPRIKEKALAPTASIEMISKKIEIKSEFINTLQDAGLDAETALHGVLSHEVNHFMFFPFDLPTHLLTVYECERISETKSEHLANLFSDVSVNLNLIFKKDNKTVNKVYQSISKAADQGKAHKLLSLYYKDVTGLGFGDTNLSKEDTELFKDKLESLKTINFLDKKNYRINARRFARVIHDLVDEKQNPENYDMTGESAFSKGKIDAKELDKAMRKVAKEINDPKAFKEFVNRHNLVEDGEKADSKKAKSKDRQAGLDGGGIKVADWYFYSKLAENYPVKLKKKPLQKDGSGYPYSYKKWEASEPIENVDYWNSFGKFLPGITQQKVLKDAMTYRREEAAPNLVLVIDSSGSMEDPTFATSNALVGGISVANIFLDNNSKVAVYNFSTKDILQDFTTDRKDVYRAICAYQGGGTWINTNTIKELVEKSDKPCDVVIISDTAIYNLGDLLSFLDKLENKNRITIVYTAGEDEKIRELKKKYSGTNTSIYSGAKDDIPKIVIGEANKSIK